MIAAHGREVLEVAVGLGTLIAMIYGAWRVMRSWFRSKTEPLRKAFAGLQQVPALQSDLDIVRKAVLPNGGTSLPDGVRRIESALLSVRNDVSMMACTMAAHNDNDPNKGTLECDASGANISVNRTYARWIGVGKDELLGWAFLNYVHQDDRERVRDDWMLAMKECRPYHNRHKMLTADGEVICVDVSATPIPDTPPIQRWVGVVRLVQ